MAVKYLTSGGMGSPFVVHTTADAKVLTQDGLRMLPDEAAAAAGGNYGSMTLLGVGMMMPAKLKRGRLWPIM